MNEQHIKYLVFIFVIFIVLSFAVGIVSNVDSLVANGLWIVLALLFVLVVWKGDVLLMLKEYERAVIMRFGKVVRVGGPGWCIVLPFIERPTVVDLRTKTIDVPKQDVITNDNIELHVDAVIYMRVGKDKQCVINSVVEVEDYTNAIKLFIISGIRDTIGSMSLSEVISNTDSIAKKLRLQAEKIATGWGIEVVSVELKEVDIPKTVIDAMHEEKASVQRKLARMETAKAHEYEIETVKRAAEQLSDKALAYYYIRALEKLGASKSTKFMFPMEITKLAESISKGIGSEPAMEKMFEKYAPAVTALLSKDEKKNIEKKVKKKP